MMKKIFRIGLPLIFFILLFGYLRYDRTLQQSKQEVANLPDRTVTEAELLAQWEQSEDAEQYREQQQEMIDKQDDLQAELELRDDTGEKETTTSDLSASPPSPITLAQGNFNTLDPIHYANGAVEIRADGDDVYVIISDAFKTPRAPDLYVALASDTGNRYTEATSLNLGPLTAFEGKQIYKVSREEFDSYNGSVKIRCRAFDVMFSVAVLE